MSALQNDQHRPERFVISVILNGDGDEVRQYSKEGARGEEGEIAGCVCKLLNMLHGGTHLLTRTIC